MSKKTGTRTVIVSGDFTLDWRSSRVDLQFHNRLSSVGEEETGE